MHRLLLLLLVALILLPASSQADIAVLSPVKDNTLYDNTVFPVSNGAGQFFFAGQTTQASFSRRRGLVAFDVDGSILAGATINSAILTLHMSKTRDLSNTQISLHRLTTDWGEGISIAPSGEGGGAAAAAGDATWLHTFFSGSFWATQGGDFLPASATATVGGVGFYPWISAGMAADVQFWLDNPTLDFGWLLLGDERNAPTARRFDSRQNGNLNFRPTLTVDFTPRVVGVESSTWGQVKRLMQARD